jgi:competence protein ComEC
VEQRNHLSLSFLLRFGHCSALVTSDTDSSALDEMAVEFGWRLKSEILVVPHHGSSGSASRALFGYAMPQTAVVPCGRDNPHGHPSTEVLDLLFELGAQVAATFESGHFTMATQGEYWY